jgi:aminopeptidase N
MISRSLLTTACATACAAAVCAGVLPAAALPAHEHDQRAVSHPQRDPYYGSHGATAVDTLHYGLRLRWAPASDTLTGRAVIRFRATRDIRRAVRLDLGDPLAVSSALIDGVAATVTREHNKVRVVTGRLAKNSRHTLTIDYAGTPRPVAAPTTRSDFQTLGWTITKSHQVWTMQEPFGALTWYPVNDQPSDKALYDVTVNVPGKWVGVFNGKLERRTTRHHRTITHWHLVSPAASYLTTIAIGDYTRYRDRGPHGLPITYWIPTSRTQLLERLRRLPEIVRWYEQRLGRYPFDRLGVVIVPGRSAMETQTLMTISASAVGSLWHETAHQWYGDAVTPKTWPDLWLNESFAMYLQARYEAAHRGTPMRQWIAYWKSYDQRLRREDGPPGRYHRSQFAESCVYTCGALMLATLKHKIGARDFALLLRRWPQRHRFTNQDRNDYIRFASRVADTRLRPFFHRWLTAKQSPARGQRG